MRFTRLARIAIVAAGLFAAQEAGAVLIGNTQGSVEFPQGTVSFADAVVGYSPNISNGQPTAAYRVPTNALGVPNYAGADTCAGECAFVSLGAGGSLTLRFVDNRLTGSGDSSPDLYIFEVGEDVEDTTVDISADGSEWHSVGAVGGSLSSVDIDAYGFGLGSAFAFVRLTDVANRDATTGNTVGADIDAVGAISTVRAVTVPEPATNALLGFALLAAFAAGRRRRRAV